MVNDTRLFQILDGIVTEEDFIDEDYRAVADILFGQYRDTGQVKPAAIVDIFEDVDKQRLVAKILQTELPFDISEDERERAVNDVIKKTKLARIDYELTQNAGDMAKFQELIMMKAKVSKMHISLKNG